MSANAAPTIEVFQDLTLWLDGRTPGEVRDALAAQAASPWRHAPEREHHDSMDDETEYFAFEREAQGDTPEIGLVLCKHNNELQVANIIPIESGQLTVRQYNHALQQFKEMVADPVVDRLGLRQALTKDAETLTDWMSPETAQLLRQFSQMANKSTGSAHPRDRARWFAFIIAAHKEQIQATDRIKRWLIEVEHWHSELAVELITEYEYGLELLFQYEQHQD